MMRKLLFFVGLVVFLLVLSGAKVWEFSPENSSVTYMSGELTEEADSMGISREYGQIGNISTYREYSFLSANGSIKRLNLSFTVETSWLQENGYAEEDVALFSSRHGYYIRPELNNGEYTARMENISDRVYFAAVKNPGDVTVTAVDPRYGLCGDWVDPGEDFRKVTSCSPVTVFLTLNRFKILGGVAVVLMLSATFYLLKKRGSEVSEVEEVTEELIQRMESGDLEKDRELLQKLEEANELAYNDRYEEANEKVKEVKSQLSGDS